MVHAKVSFPSGCETSSVSTRSFTEVSTETEDDDFFGGDCDDVPQLMITIVPSEGRGDYSVTMYPKNYVKPVVDDDRLKFNLNKEYRSYKGEAGVIVYMPDE